MTALTHSATVDVPLYRIAQGRSGDKNDTSDITIFFTSRELFDVVGPQLSSVAVKDFLAPLVAGAVQRYELPKLFALKFVCHEALGGGGSSSLRSDNLGKSMASALMRWVARGVPQVLVEESPLFAGPTAHTTQQEHA